MGKKDSEAEDLAIQDTLMLSPEERLELLAALIVEKISEDQKNGGVLYRQLVGETT